MKTLKDLLDKETLDKARALEIAVNNNAFGQGNPVKITIQTKKGPATETLPSQLETCRYLHQCLRDVGVNKPIPEKSFVSRTYIKKAVDILNLKGIKVTVETAPVRKVVRNSVATA